MAKALLRVYRRNDVPVGEIYWISESSKIYDPASGEVTGELGPGVYVHTYDERSDEEVSDLAATRYHCWVK